MKAFQDNLNQKIIVKIVCKIQIQKIHYMNKLIVTQNKKIINKYINKQKQIQKKQKKSILKKGKLSIILILEIVINLKIMKIN